MRMNIRYVRGFIKLSVSQLIEANRKTAALDFAHHFARDNKLELSKVIVLDDEGCEHRAFVDKVTDVKWFNAEQTEIANRYRIVGKIGLHVYMEVDEECSCLSKPFSLLHSALYDSPTLVFAAGTDNIFLRVTDYDIEWETVLRKSAQFLTAV